MDIEAERGSVADKAVRMIYTNYRGETAERLITPKRVEFGSTEWHPKPQWLLVAWDHDKKAERAFAVTDIKSFKPHKST